MRQKDMSRIQQSIRSAKESRIQEKKSDSTSSASQDYAPAELKSAVPSAKVDLKPGRFATLDPDHLERNRIISGNLSGDAVTPYKILRTRVLQKMEKRGWRVLAITAAHEGAGKSITAINLAITIAQSGGHNVYLLDVDLRKPGIGRSLGLTDVEDGLGEYLSLGRGLEDVMWNVGVDNLTVIPGTDRFPNSSEMLTSPAMEELINILRSDPSGPIIIVDLPPVLVTDDALAIAPMMDCLLFVVSESETKRADLLHSMELLRDVELAGVVLNKSKDTHPGY